MRRSERIASAHEAVVRAARFLQREVRFSGILFEHGVRIVCLKGGTPGAWKNLIGALEQADCARADREVASMFECDGRKRQGDDAPPPNWPRSARTGGRPPKTARPLPVLRRRLPRPTLDE